MDRKKFYITTAIDYVNDVIHLGHIFQKVIADVLARYYRIKLGEKDVFFLTGTDEYGHKAEKAAETAKLPVREFVDKIAKADQEQQDCLKVSYNRFIRTTDKDHAETVTEIWKRIDQSGDIYLGEYTGLYCEGCEAYYTDEDLVDGKCCPFHPTLEVKKVTEKNYFFKWSKYKDFLVDYLTNNPEFVFPESRRKEMIAFAKTIKDIPISRSNFKWGIPVPNDPGQVIYVWFDALTNYLTGVGFLENKELFEKFWPADIHILGKDNARWHALLWPAMLKSAGIELPKTILVNGFINLDGQKISKSLGNIIRPTDWVEKYGVDPVRYFLLRYTTVTEDSDISEEKLKVAYNSDLANGLGNLVARVAKLAEQTNFDASKLKYDRPNSVLEEIAPLIEQYKLNQALDYIWGCIGGLDKYITRERPWQKEATQAKKILGEIIIGSEALTSIIEIAEALQPFLPETSEKILKQFSGQIKSGPPLFPRI